MKQLLKILFNPVNLYIYNLIIHSVRLIYINIIALLLLACSSKKSIRSSQPIDVPIAREAVLATEQKEKAKIIQVVKIDQITSPVVDDTTFVNLYDYSRDFIYKMKYATSDNFLKTKVYDCEACYLRYQTVIALLKAQEKFQKKGFRIVLYDCYRPLDIQKKMWQMMPNPSYVADPKKGSIHNRGGAVDISLADLNGNELDMGTSFDYFGPEAAQDYDALPEEVLKNRKLLRNTMIRSGFRIFESEWWHYNLKNARRESISNFQWKCD